MQNFLSQLISETFKSLKVKLCVCDPLHNVICYFFGLTPVHLQFFCFISFICQLVCHLQQYTCLIAVAAATAMLIIIGKFLCFYVPPQHCFFSVLMISDSPAFLFVYCVSNPPLADCWFLEMALLSLYRLHSLLVNGDVMIQKWQMVFHPV